MVATVMRSYADLHQWNKWEPTLPKLTQQDSEESEIAVGAQSPVQLIISEQHPVRPNGKAPIEAPDSPPLSIDANNVDSGNLSRETESRAASPEFVARSMGMTLGGPSSRLPSPPPSMNGSQDRLSVGSAYLAPKPTSSEFRALQRRRVSNSSVSFAETTLTRTTSPEAIDSIQNPQSQPSIKPPVRVYSLGDTDKSRLYDLNAEDLKRLSSKILVYEDGVIRTVKWRKEQEDFCRLHISEVSLM